MGLPIELFELAIDSLDDEQSLRTTSLVCKAWLPRSRLNLFRLIELCLPRHLDYFAALLSEAPHIAEYVKVLDVSENSLLALFRPAMAIIARLPHMLSAYPLVQAHRLAVHNLLWLPTRYNPDYLYALSQLTSITSLDLFDVTFTTVADFSIVLRAFGRLTFLSVKHLDCQRQLDPATMSDIGCTLPFLTTLRVVSYHPTSVIDWLLRYNDFPALHDVDCSYELSTHDNGQGLGVFWTKTGATLRTLCIGISRRSASAHIPTEVIEHQLDLSPCRTMQTLRIDCRHERGIAPDWAWLTWLLSHLTCRSLRSITFAFQTSSHALASLHAFSEKLDAVLTSSLFSEELSSVVFDFDFRDPTDPDDERFVGLFPTLLAKGLLQVA